jgi:hypothetical protein
LLNKQAEVNDAINIIKPYLLEIKRVWVKGSLLYAESTRL